MTHSYGQLVTVRVSLIQCGNIKQFHIEGFIDVKFEKYVRVDAASY